MSERRPAEALRPGDRVPEATVWAAPGGEALLLADAIAGEGLVLLCFYPFDWSTGCTNEMLLLRNRGDDLRAAGIRAFGISRDSPSSHVSWAMTLGVDNMPLLSDWNGEATRAFGVAFEYQGMVDIAARSAFLIDGDTVRASWMLGREMPDVDAVVAAASSPSP